MNTRKGALLIAAIAAATSPEAGMAAGAAAAGSTESSGTLEEIVVTAQRRSENQQVVPIAITSVSAESAALMGVTTSDSLAVAVPALQFLRQTGNGATPYIRGVGFIQASAGNEGPVAVYVDDVYIGAPAANIFSFNNIEGINVLKGAQGTLFGRNATGGVVQVQTKQPSQKQETDITLGYGSFNTKYGQLYFNTPLSDTMSANIAFTGHDQSRGYGTNVVSGEDTLKGWDYGLRTEFLWRPSARTTVWLEGDYSRSNSDFGMDVVVWPGTISQRGVTNQGRFATYDYPNDSSPNKNFGTSLKVTQEFDAVTLKSISAYRVSAYCLNLNVNATTTGSIVQNIGCVTPPGFASATNMQLSEPITRTISEELQLLSNSEGRLKWIVGAFFYRSTVDGGVTATWGTAAGATGFRANAVASILRLDSTAGYADATYSITANTKLSAGIRYTTDKFDRSLPQSTGSLSKATYRLVLDRQFTPDVMGYVSYSTGYHTGGLSAPITLPGPVTFIPPPIKPEYLKDAEAGVKSELFGKHLRLNVSVFHYDYANLQVSQVLAGNSQILNAGAAKMDGAELDWQWAPNSRFNVGGGFSALNARFTDFPGGPTNIQRPAVCTPVPASTGAPTGGNLGCTIDLSGYKTPRSPPFTMNLNATYTKGTSIGNLSATATIYHNSGFYWEPDNQYKQGAYNLLNLTTSWTSRNEEMVVRAYGRNLTNTYYDAYFSSSSIRSASSPAMPRNFGIEISSQF